MPKAVCSVASREAMLARRTSQLTRLQRATYHVSPLLLYESHLLLDGPSSTGQNGVEAVICIDEAHKEETRDSAEPGRVGQALQGQDDGNVVEDQEHADRFLADAPPEALRRRSGRDVGEGEPAQVVVAQLVCCLRYVERP